MEVIETRFEAIQWGAFEAEHFADLSRGNDYVLYKVLPVPFPPVPLREQSQLRRLTP